MNAISVRQALSLTRKRLFSAGIANAEQESAWLICHALGISAAGLFAYGDRLLSSAEAAAAEDIAKRRESGEPLQYILGTAPFFGRDFTVGPGVLIPRQDTETLVEAALELFGDDERFSFLDWGTGSGCIAASILLERTEACAFMAEKNPASLRYAEENIRKFCLESRARIIRSESPDDITLPCPVDMVVSNPPYIPAAEIGSLMREVREHEPHMALDGGDDGMDFYRMLIRYSPRWLRPGGFLVLEAGSGEQAEGIRQASCGGESGENFKFIKNIMDISEIPRCVVLKYLG